MRKIIADKADQLMAMLNKIERFKELHAEQYAYGETALYDTVRRLEKLNCEILDESHHVSDAENETHHWCNELMKLSGRPECAAVLFCPRGSIIITNAINNNDWRTLMRLHKSLLRS